MIPAVRAFLGEPDEPRFGVLATINPDGTPQLTVIWYLIDGDDLLFNTKRGRLKADNLGRDQRIAVCVEDGYRYVTISGRAREVTDPDAGHRDIERLATRYQGAESARRSMRRFSQEERVSYRLPLRRVHAYGFEAAS